MLVEWSGRKGIQPVKRPDPLISKCSFPTTGVRRELRGIRQTRSSGKWTLK